MKRVVSERFVVPRSRDLLRETVRRGRKVNREGQSPIDTRSTVKTADRLKKMEKELRVLHRLYLTIFSLSGTKPIRDWYREHSDSESFLAPGRRMVVT